MCVCACVCVCVCVCRPMRVVAHSVFDFFIIYNSNYDISTNANSNNAKLKLSITGSVFQVQRVYTRGANHLLN